jgi:hypothetical protein
MRPKSVDAPATEETRDSKLTAVLKPLRRTDVTQLVVDHLRDLLEQGVLKPESKLPPEPEMSKLLGISRPSLRQASRLSAFLELLGPYPETAPTSATRPRKHCPSL